MNFNSLVLDKNFTEGGKRAKAKSKRSGPNDESIAGGAMDEEEDRFGKGAVLPSVKFLSSTKLFQNKMG